MVLCHVVFYKQHKKNNLWKGNQKISQAKPFENEDLKSNTWEKTWMRSVTILNTQEAKIASCQVPSSAETTCEWQCVFQMLPTWLHNKEITATATNNIMVISEIPPQQVSSVNNWVLIHRFICMGIRKFHYPKCCTLYCWLYIPIYIYYCIIPFISTKQMHFCQEKTSTKQRKWWPMVTGSDHAKFLPAVDVEALELLSWERNCEVGFGLVEPRKKPSYFGCLIGILIYKSLL